MHRRRLLPDRHGGQARATFDLVAPLAHEATAMCITEIVGHTAPGRSGTVSPLIDASLRQGDIDGQGFFDDGVACTLIGKKSAGRKLDGRTWDEYPS